jgi:hypothetical protein
MTGGGIVTLLERDRIHLAFRANSCSYKDPVAGTGLSTASLARHRMTLESQVRVTASRQFT